MKNRISLISFLAVMLLTACVDKQWSVSGNIEGADGKPLLLEASDNGWWYPLDTVEVKKGGDFEFAREAKGYPDIYRLNLNGKMVYFPIDSIESVTVTSNADAFDRSYVISGSAAADMMMEVDKKIMTSLKENGEIAIATDSVLKRELASMLLNDPSGIVAYYIINKKAGNTLLFNPQNKSDLRIIGAVANAYSEMRPNDPRTSYLKKLFLSNRSVQRAASTTVAPDTVFIDESPLIEIALSDYTGKTHSLTELAKQKKVIVLNFTLYNVEQSPAYNVELAKIYEKRKSAGLEIYQIALDQDEFQWKQSAMNLPWITVYNSPVTGAQNLVNYNVTNVPTTFIIDRNGDLVERVDNLAELDAKLSKYM